MTPSNPYSNYRDTQIKTASPITLIILLYEGAVREISKGEALLRGDQDQPRFNQAANHLLRAMNIVAELQGILNPDQAPELAHGLSETYKAVLFFISAALQDKDPAPLAKACEIMNSLLTAWRETAERVAQQAG